MLSLTCGAFEGRGGGSVSLSSKLKVPIQGRFDLFPRMLLGLLLGSKLDRLAPSSAGADALPARGAVRPACEWAEDWSDQ